MNEPFEIRDSITLTSAGKKLFGILHLPLGSSDEKWPVVLFCNGFGGHKSGKFRLAVRLAERLSKLGIASFRFDYRGTGDSEGDFEEITISSQFEDTSLAKKYLQNHPSIDASRIAILGRSFGGIIATMVSGHAIVLWAPVFDAKPWLEGQVLHQAIRIEAENGVRFAGHALNKTFLKELQALDAPSNLECIQKVPLFVIQGKKDTTLGSYHFERYKEARAKSASVSQFFELAESNHDFDLPEEQEIALEMSANWFKTHLQR